MPADPAIIKSLFLELAAIDDLTARAAKLLERCGADSELLARVSALLAANDRAVTNGGTASFADDALTADPDAKATTKDMPSLRIQIGTVLGGKYKLVEEIGEGGMGSVYLAQQTEPVKRRVAVKVIKAGMDSKAVLARFDAERQALAMMDHPNIAKVLDAGMTPPSSPPHAGGNGNSSSPPHAGGLGGVPYFVMELVKGVPITEYCDAHKLTPRQRLELFVPVCQAIQHAHMKGVIHRDIKPSNVLIALYDDKPVPKVIDFGVAKATGASLTDHSLVTGHGAVVGTPEYMSPEQASFNNLDIDTRSDVYSLGVLLYELLTGSTPVDRKSLGRAAVDEILRIVREVEARKPSAKLSTIDTLPSVAANRSTEPAKLSKLMKGELDWVVLKALEKDRTRRYDTANGLARDIQRYLADEIVEARPPSARYRLKKFVRRHKGRVVATAAFVLLLLASVAVSSWLAVQAKRAEVVAERNADAFYGAVIKADEALQQVEMTVASQQVDADLAELKTDPRFGLLRMAGRLRASPTVQTHRHYPLQGGGEIALQASPEILASQKALREFATAAVLVNGQEYASLLPPLPRLYGPPVRSDKFNYDRLTVLTIDSGGLVRHWERRTAQVRSVLRERTEKIVQYGFSPDGKTMYTQDLDSVVRFWNPDGTFRAKTPQRADRFVYPLNIPIQELFRFAESANHIVIGNRTIVQSAEQITITRMDKREWSAFNGPCGPNELYEMATGRLLARLDTPGRRLDKSKLRFSPGGRFLATIEETDRTDGGPPNPNSQLVVFAADTGRTLVRLDFSNKLRDFEISPGDKWLLTHCDLNNPLVRNAWQMWDTRTWAQVPLEFLNRPDDAFLFWNDQVLARWTLGDYNWINAIHRIEGGTLDFNNTWTSTYDAVSAVGDNELIKYNSTQLLDARTLKRLLPPPGLRYHPALAQFSPDGRFVDDIDTRTEKSLGDDLRGGAFVPSLGTLIGSGWDNKLLPLPKFLNIPPTLLQLWAQVAVRGELGPEGEFVKWDAATWERKRQELAATPPPFPDFPFPGHVATDKLHWLRAEYNAAATDADKLRLATNLHHLAEATGDKPETARWRTELSKLVPEVAPLPREKK